MTLEKSHHREKQIQEYNQTPVRLEAPRIAEDSHLIDYSMMEDEDLQEPKMQIQNHSSSRQLTTSTFDTTVSPSEIIAQLKTLGQSTSLRFEVLQSVKSDSAEIKCKRLSAKLKFFSTPYIGFRRVQFVKREGPQKAFDILMAQVQQEMMKYLRPVYE